MPGKLSAFYSNAGEPAPGLEANPQVVVYGHSWTVAISANKKDIEAAAEVTISFRGVIWSGIYDALRVMQKDLKDCMLSNCKVIAVLTGVNDRWSAD